jgi:hypothetical protein
MSGHVHLGIILAIEIALILPLVNFGMRMIAGMLHQTSIGRALAVLY